ncbi:MAG TPA: ArdC-like ssDNA-binding domain-containing protein [Solirubrobacterales bacterium]|jgi:antirestriction protein ArdC|nr:ArdC-like ssDNA-binding domain-containing protein [Solirubrobacterales bacterium]
MSTTKTKRRPPTEEERTERRAAEREQMRQAIEALRTSEGWQRWLGVRRHFHGYSFHNQLLIAMQGPEATRVAGFRRWLELGYGVRKGEKAIRIWAPCPPSKKQLARWREAGANPDKEPRTFFRLVPVFDASQVSPLPEFPGEPVPLGPPHEPIAGEGLADRLPPLVEFADSLELEIAIEKVRGAALGYHEPATGRIVVEDVGPGFSANAQVSVLVHELAHALVRIDRREDDPRLDHAAEEVVVESVAYSVCASLGLDSAGAAVPYVTGWAERAEGDPIEAYAGLIDRLARRIEGAVCDEV